MKRIVFSGYLQKMYPEGIEVEADTAAEAISALALWPGFRAQDNVQHNVVMPQFGSRDALYERTHEPVLLVVPMQMAAGGRNGFFQVVLGTVLIVVGLFLGPTPLGVALIKVGASLVLGGIIQMLMPQPEIGSASQEEKSAYLPAGRNTAKVGTRIPLLFGRRRIWGHFLALNVTASNRPKPEKPKAGTNYATNVTAVGYDTETHQGGY